ncbi:Hypothetical protein CINCED_3A023353 [Cinara cedri]|uniref:Uncharacterized protein n=1 Tax=Cinara cedri TaxID=506608 RepID=A0A5E4NHZ1_9HEMI|nr:Hypothetical protein CINCED_3A023353 [Cinara cedri]
MADSCKSVPLNVCKSHSRENIYENVLCAWCHEYGHLFGFTCKKFVAAYMIYSPKTDVFEKTGNYNDPVVIDKTPRPIRSRTPPHGYSPSDYD